jgi:hypothetical protein
MRNSVLVSLAAAALFLPAPGVAQQGAPEESTIKDTANSVAEPFDGKEPPQKLLEVQDDPYSLAGLGKCAAIIREVEELDAVLGPDVNQRAQKSEAKKREETAGRVAGNAERRRYAVAVYAGTVRRGFLKGVGLERGCKAPARP